MIGNFKYQKIIASFPFSVNINFGKKKETKGLAEGLMILKYIQLPVYMHLCNL